MFFFILSWKRFLKTIVLFAFAETASAQTTADSVTIVFRTHQSPSSVCFVPGQFNNWGSNASGVIAPGDASQMSYNGGIGAWTKAYIFKIHDPSDSRRNLGDSVFQYKFNQGGSQNGWYSDPLNPETNPTDNSNSVLRLTKLFWFEFYGTEVSQQITRITVGLVHANSDTITSIKYSTGQTPTSSLTTYDMLAFYNDATRTLDFNLPSSVNKLDFIRLVAHNNKGDSVVYSRGGIVVQTMAMPAYVQHGVTLPSASSGDSASFRLEVPGKSYLLLRIALVGQSPQAANTVVMRKSPGSNDWWTNIKLNPGDYEYIYEFENGTKINDPWGRWNGSQGSRFTIGAPGLSADDYVWNVQNFQRPAPEKLVIYELNVAEYATGGKNFADFINYLPHLDSLGINAIELMPINDYGGVGLSGFSWGYDLNSYLALEPYYGTPYNFKALVDAAHARGIAVIVDVVFNHLTDSSPLWQMLPDTAVNPYFKNPADLRPNEDGLVFFRDMDHWTIETQELVYSALKMWIDVYKIDGFRYDYTQGIGWTPKDTTKGILGWSRRIYNEYGGSIYQIAEHLPDNPALLFHAKLTSSWHDSFRDEVFRDLRSALNQRPSLATIGNFVLDLNTYFGNDFVQSDRYFTRVGPVNANVTHDEQSLIYEMTTFQGVSSIEAIQRDKLYATFMFTSLGIPMLWEGMEIGQSRGWTIDGLKLSYRPVDWSLLSTAGGAIHFNYYRTLVLQRVYNPALYRGTLVRPLYENESQRSLAWGFVDTLTNSKIVAVANLSGATQILTNVTWLGTGTWYDVFDQSTYSVTQDPVSTFNIPAFTARVFSNRTNVDLGITTSVSKKDVQAPASFALHQNYPNPFNPSTTIEYDLLREGNVSLKVYNILGSEIAVLVDARQSAGTHSVSWSGKSKSGVLVGSGVYFVRLESNGLVDVKKLVLVR